MDEKIIINIDNLRARKIHPQKNNQHFFIDKYSKKIKDLIKSRIHELDDTNNERFQDYFEYKMHDSILIYGTRGNGKTTIMMNLKEMIHDEDYLIKHTRILEIIDPTLLEENEDFLLVILKSVYNEILEYEQSSEFDSDKKSFERQLENILEQIEGTRATLNREIEIFDKFHGNKSGVGLAKAIHELFYTATKVFKVRAMILPIDDIDMNMHQGYTITETIRKYLASPYIIPIVSFNLKQMNAVAKKNKYEAFGLNFINIDLDKNRDLEFLLSLPSDYLASIFPPNRRIFLKSIFKILKDTIEKDGKSIYLKSEKLKTINKDVNQIELTSILNLFLEMVYEKRFSNFKEGKIDDYLTNRSIRDFLNDMSSIINSLPQEGTDVSSSSFKSNQNILLERFAPENQNMFINKEQALLSLWNDFLDIAKKNINKDKINLTDNEVKNNWAKLITQITYEDYAELANKKTYRRLWLQRYYYPKRFKIEKKDSEFIIKKKTSISGFLELCLRSYIPMFLFEEIISRHKIQYSVYEIMKLREMAKTDLFNVAYYLSNMELFLKQDNYKSEITDEALRKHSKLFASININYHKNEIQEPKFNIPFLFKLRKQDLFFDKEQGSRQIYFFSIFKSIAFFIESLKILEEYIEKNRIKYIKDIYKDELQTKLEDEVRISFKKLFERYRINLPCVNDTNFVENYLNNLLENGYIEQLWEIKTLDLKNSELGIIECMKFSKRLIRFFYDTRSNINLNDNFSSLNFETNTFKQNIEEQGEGTLSEYFSFPLSTYLSGFFQSLLISLRNTQQDMKDLDIFTINSIHGANLTILKKDKDGKYKLSKVSNAFLSNINYLYTSIKNIKEISISEKYSTLNEYRDQDYQYPHQNIDEEKSKSIDKILNLYENFFNIPFFNQLLKNYSVADATEDCNIMKEKNNASKN